MRTWKKSYDFAFLTVYLSIIIGIGLWTLHLRHSELSQPKADDWQAWRAEAAKENGTHGPVARQIPPSAEPPMRVMMRDNFPTILGAAIVFPSIIFGFFLLMLRGVLRQSCRPPARS